MSIFIAIIILIIGLILLTKGADYFIENSASLAEERGISPHVIGVTIVAFGTSLPELLVSIFSSYGGYNDLALGNILGSNISNIGLVLAISTFIFYYVLKENISPDKEANKDSYVMISAVLLLYVFSRDNLISKNEGIMFFSLYLSYIYWIFKRADGLQIIRESEINEQLEAVKRGLADGKTSYTLLIGGLAGLLIGAQLTVDSAVDIALALGLSEIVIGLSVVAVGTSLPELAGTISAAKMGHKELALGNIIGSNITNIFLVMGFLAVIKPIFVEVNVTQTTLPLLILLTIAAFGFIRIPLTRFNGSILFAFFILFIYQLTLI
ncbi:MAG: sodium:proton exchanger [Methanobacteriota archaeon]|jgi:cation:H+ antiporter|nr:MAG: sodium:proton exchanger [Euryarchaeota archaeon]